MIGVRPPTALQKHQPERGGIQRPGRSYYLRGYHNYLWGWAQPQVTDSINTTSTLSITTLATYDNQSIRSKGDPVTKYKHYTLPCLTNALRYEIDNQEDISVNRENKYKALESYKEAETRFARPPRAPPKPLSLTPNSK